MQTIITLDNETINKIAAGEVVERPSSVVKELVENAIDARASAITVEIADGGISMIRVTDNGSGIDKDDIDQAFKRHATSKIRSAVDLITIGSLGFRGEALSSIAAVSQVELITKTHKDLTGTRCLIDGGGELKKEEIGCPDGTTFIIRNLFFNTPARRKFLKTPQTEGSYVSELIDRLALSHPEISFNFIMNRQSKLHTSGNANVKDIIYHVYGRDVTRQLLEAEADTELLHISGYIGKPILSRGNRNWENYFINGRFIKSNIITKAIEDAYKTFVMIHKFPFCVLHFDIAPELIDVNVHPRKMEIRFNQNEAVYQQVYDTVRAILEGRELIPSVAMTDQKSRKAEEKVQDIPEPFEIRRLASLGADKVAEKRVDYHSGGSGKISVKRPAERPSVLKEPVTVTEKKAPGPVKARYEAPSKAVAPAAADKIFPKAGLQVSAEKPEQLTLADDRFLSKQAGPRHRMIGQIFDTYWMAEYDGKLFIIDQHAAHEKVLYERFCKALSLHQTDKQLLTPPSVVTLTAVEQEILKRYKDVFADMAFEIEPFGGNEYAIYAVPLQLYGMNAGDIFIEILDQLSEESTSIEGSKITYHIASMACKAAVKGGNKLSFAEADALLTELMEADNPYTCPHGRPTIISISRYEMEKRFKRIQS